MTTRRPDDEDAPLTPEEQAAVDAQARRLEPEYGTTEPDDKNGNP
ncbi:hypothetical protein [Nocardiopsis sp. JB363]|nr:hypothetical protein [Nocardiopsis sp. JB363]SIO89006.1 hypothetical protein BQ8420_20435 [Nocardiopsis sp. JB363]